MIRGLQLDQPTCPRPFQIGFFLDQDTSLMRDFMTQNGSDKTARDHFRPDGAGFATGVPSESDHRG